MQIRIVKIAYNGYQLMRKQTSWLQIGEWLAVTIFEWNYMVLFNTVDAPLLVLLESFIWFQDTLEIIALRPGLMRISELKINLISKSWFFAVKSFICHKKKLP